MYCNKRQKNQKSITTRNFFKNAYEKIGAETIHMLRISDYNTSGLTGSRGLINTNWTNLTKSSGVSDKRGAAGGSFGIGTLICAFLVGPVANIFLPFNGKWIENLLNKFVK